MSLKMKNIRVNELYGNTPEVNMINFIAQYGAQTQNKPYVKIHGSFSHYVETNEVIYIIICTGEFQIIPVTIFLVMLYDACFMFQKDKGTNMLIKALDTFDSRADVIL